MKNNDVFHSGVKHRLCKCSDYHICTPQGNVLSFRINNFISQDADPDHLLEVKVQEIQKDDPEKHFIYKIKGRTRWQSQKQFVPVKPIDYPLSLTNFLLSISLSVTLTLPSPNQDMQIYNLCASEL